MSAQRLTYDEARAVARALTPLRVRGDGVEQPGRYRRSEYELLAFLAWGCRRATGEVGKRYSTRDLARHIYATDDTVKRARRRLVDDGLLEILQPGGSSSTTRYRVAIERGRR